MKCSQCGAEVPENSNFCPSCGYKFVNEQPQIMDDPAHQVINTSTTMSGAGSSAVDLSYRDKPGFKSKIIMLNIVGAIASVCSGLACFGSIMLRFGKNLTSTDYLVYLLMLIIGVFVGLLTAFVFILPAGKKLFPDGKARGFLENLPGVWVALCVAGCVIALIFQGVILFIS